MNDLSQIKEMIQPGDVLNFSNDRNQPALYRFVDDIVVETQKKQFGEQAHYFDYHTELYFDDYTILSVQPPYPVFLGLNDVFFTGETVSIYRRDYIDLYDMRSMANKIVWEQNLYNVGELLDDFFDTYLNIPKDKSIELLSFGTNNLVCSVGVAMCFEYANFMKNKGRVFDNWDIHRIFPCMFANGYGFYFVGAFINGVKQ